MNLKLIVETITKGVFENIFEMCIEGSVRISNVNWCFDKFVSYHIWLGCHIANAKMLMLPQESISILAFAEC